MHTPPSKQTRATVNTISPVSTRTRIDPAKCTKPKSLGTTLMSPSKPSSKTPRSPDRLPMELSTPRMKALAAGRTFASGQLSDNNEEAGSSRSPIKMRGLLAKANKASSSQSKWDMLTDSNCSVRILAQGHVHAKQELTEIDKWRHSISESFLNPPQPPTVPRLLLRIPEPIEPVPRSPDHFERKYGVKRGSFSPRISPRRNLQILEPLKLCGTLASDGVQVSGRAAVNALARAECWKRARVHGDPTTKQSAFFDASAPAPPSPVRG